MRFKTTYLAITILALSTLIQGCAFMVGAAAGGAAGYMLQEKGYEVQSPVKRKGT
ncbi:hypothetical protein [Sedimenticola sp.]|uniref:hypothetical protein n=1 Tax=Sedimenticola sp. TaxID=1940285 RepID=UPI003D0AACC1